MINEVNNDKINLFDGNNGPSTDSNDNEVYMNIYMYMYSCAYMYVYTCIYEMINDTNNDEIDVGNDNRGMSVIAMITRYI
jgi:hypothetical protein